MRKLILILILLLCANVASAATYYVATDGGPGDECDGTTSDAWDEVDDDVQESCAFNHPNWGLPANGQPTTYKMSGGDTLIIEEGSYKMGCQNDVNCADALYNYTNTANCHSSWTYECGMADVPSGSASKDTLIVGCADSGCGTGNKPELYMVGRLNGLFNIGDTQYATFQDLEITDHWGNDGECGHGVPVQPCGRTAFHSGWGTKSWHNLTFDGVDIHGLTRQGMLIGGSGTGFDSGTFLMKDSNLDGNKMAGLDMDTCGNDGTCGVEGNMTFQNTTMRWNGCSEAYPVVWGADGEDGVDGRLPTAASCREGNNGGYGDMIGASSTGGTWTFTDCNLSHNTSDAIDLLYCSSSYGGCSLTVKRTLMEGNNGQVLKIGVGSMYVEDSLIIGNCSFWHENAGGYEAPGFGACRAGGTPISSSFSSGDEATFINNTILSEGDLIFWSDGASCIWNNYNNILVGGYQYCQDNVAMYYTESCATEYTINEDYNICWQDFKSDEAYTHCTNTNDQLDVDPDFTGSVYTGTSIYTCSGNRYTGTTYYQNLSLLGTSSAIDGADETVSGADEFDYGNDDRGVSWDIGAQEYQPIESTFVPQIMIMF